MSLQTLSKFFSRRQKRKTAQRKPNASVPQVQPSSMFYSLQFTVPLSGTARIAQVTPLRPGIPLLVTENTEMGLDWYIHMHANKVQGRLGYHCSGRRRDCLFSLGFWIFFFPLFLIAKPATGVENGEGEGKRIW